MHRNQGGVDDPRCGVGAVLRSKRCALYRYQVADDPIGPDWLVANRTASARVVRLVRRWTSTSSTRTASGRPTGARAVRAGLAAAAVRPGRRCGPGWQKVRSTEPGDGIGGGSGSMSVGGVFMKPWHPRPPISPPRSAVIWVW